ncbi:MAG TPA: hypothetical protein VGC66_18665 [Pyrinomonadaceae bacterium]|jgi:hypothetical protein
MLLTSKLRSGSGNGFTRTLKCSAAALVLAILLPVATSAYTVVLRNGRSIDIPANFSVTRAGITYEYAPGLFVTIQMTSIDAAATERANNEPQGSLLNRAVGEAGATVASPSSPANVTRQGARRTLTDRELEATRTRREASEAAYERRRVELGLPSIEETRRQREEETRRLSEMAARTDSDEAQAEGYWRVRAAELRTAIAVNDAEINYVYSKLRETPGYYPTVSFTNLASFPFVSPVVGSFPVPAFPNASAGMPEPPRGFTRREPLSGRAGFGGGSTRGRVFFNPRGAYTGFPRRRAFGRTGIAGLPLPVYAPYAYNNYSYDQSALTTRLHELEAERAGLQARWRLLEDEARRAGAPPGWLRP